MNAARDLRWWLTSWTGLDPVTMRAIRDGARPGDLLPPRERRAYILGVADDAEVVIVGSASGRQVAVLFSHQSFPGVRFGHRFPPLPDPSALYRSIWLMEEIETGALHRMMRDQAPADGAGIVWTTWRDSQHENP